MRRSPPLQFLAAAAIDATAMSSRSPYRGGRNQWQRGFSDRPYNGGRGPFVSGDSHFRSVRDANLGLRQGDLGSLANQTAFQPEHFNPRPRPYNQHQQFRQPPPYNQNHQVRQPPPPHRNKAFRPPQQFQPRPPKPLDYRNWEYAKMPPPPNCERFVVLSYNILADYLAIGHRSKLYFHIPRYMLDWEWRKKNIIFELGLWSADILCFQEVDRFQDLEEELKIRGYSGIWKMRTGNPIDGCAIFWRTWRFKLLHEECVEFNKLGLRDNIAQICVLELLSQNNAQNMPALPTSSAHSNKLVICNIHVLYNPKRGEIKLGQVRVLLDRAHAVSKIWNDAPVVLCGDFNCTPKSPLYNFISEQKLELSGLDRDKVSGQASAEIRAPRPNIPNSGPQSADGSIRELLTVDGVEVGNKLSDSLPFMKEQNNPDINVENLSIMKNLSQPEYSNTVLDECDKSCADMRSENKESALYDDLTRETQQTEVDASKVEIRSAFSVSIDSSMESTCNLHRKSRFPDGQMDEIHKFSPPEASSPEDVYHDVTEMGHKEKVNATSHSNLGSLSKHTDSNIPIESESSNCHNTTLSLVGDNHSTSLETDPEFMNNFGSVSSSKLICQTCFSHDAEVSASGNSSNMLIQLIANDEKGPSTPCQVNVSSTSTGIDFVVDEKLQKFSFNELDEAMENGENIGEDNNAFLSALHNNDDVFPTNEVPDDFSPGVDSEAVDIVKTAYDPSLWTPMEMAMATGNVDCTFLEHPLKLKSTYTEVEDCSGTRDSNGEPLVTSYNRCFLGTVDYIWCSDGLRTLRVLAPIPKHALQWTPGFPTKKWGSDHIALASELAFTKDVTGHNTEVQ